VSFPGSSRRFERLADNLYTDYGHHPVEIAATLQLARELSDHVVLVYQPHQNTRQHTVRSSYTTCMEQAEEIYWLPTFQTREDSQLPILTPEQLIERLTNKDNVIISDLNDELWQHIQAARANGKLVLCMGAGTIDGWVRQQLLTD
jgi:UDP-N-acetylmuramate--alanine ligase